MLYVIGDNLTLTFAVAVSPPSIIALIVFMMSGSRAKAIAFLAGWFTISVALTGLAAVLGSNTSADDLADADGVPWLAVVLAALFGWLSIRSLRNRPTPGEPVPAPAWLEKLNSMRPIAAFLVAAALIGANAKNLPVFIAMGTDVAEAGLGTVDSVITVVILAVLCSLSAIVIVVWGMVGKDSTATLSTWREWLVAHNAAIMAGLFGILAVAQLGKILQAI